MHVIYTIKLRNVKLVSTGIKEKTMKKKPGPDTIAALCTAPGGALAILRLSGPDALNIGRSVWRGKRQLNRASARKMLLGKAGASPDRPGSGEPCLAVFLPGPNSYTGEDTVELHSHGGNLAPRRLLDAVLCAGARSAMPGEFTRRAFLNGKMDLTQAEAVADLINAKSDRAALLAEKQLSGLLGSAVRACREPLTRLLAELEARLDFPEEELDWAAPEEYLATIANVSGSLQKMIHSAKNGVILRSGIRAVIAGRPNAGKSSLLNALLGFDRAIVTAIPGTTRDTVEEFVALRDIPVRLTDTAGLRDHASNPAEQLGIERSRDTLKSAACIFWVLDASTADSARKAAEYFLAHQTPRVPVIALWNKTDLPSTPAQLPQLPASCPALRISALTGAGLEPFLDCFAQLMWDDAPDGATVSECEVSARHAGLLSSALASLEQAAAEIGNSAWELAAFQLRNAVASLGAITGEEIIPDLLDQIFSRFCIGK